MSIEDWKQYSKQSHDYNFIHFQFRDLLDSGGTMAYNITEFSKCAHNKFGLQEDAQNRLLEILWRFVTSKNFIEYEMERITKAYGLDGSNGLSITPGICINCIQKFIIRTNGLNDIFANWHDITYNDLRWRKEFNYTNILLIRQPIFLKCLLLPSNMNSLKNIFNLFFVSFLQKIDFDLVVNKNIYNYADPFDFDDDEIRSDYYEIYDVFSHDIIPENINIMHGIEYSLCSLSTTVCGLLPLLKVNHIQYLFINNKPMANVAIIIDKFIAQYVSMPHIAMHYSMKNLHKFTGLPLNETDWYDQFDSYEEEYNIKIWQYWVESKHVFVHRLLIIIIRLYTKLKHYHKKMMKQNHFSDESFIKQLKSELMLFEYFMYHTCCDPKEITIKDHIWHLVAAMMRHRYSNREEEMRCNRRIYCTVCHKQRTDEKNTFKVCSNCKVTYYCRRKCQKYDWNVNQHKQICKQIVNAMNVA